MSVASELKRILGDLRTSQSLDACAIISRNGIPIAWELPEGVHIETFATLSATLLGASEVVYSSLKKEPPERVFVESRNATLVATGLGTKALLVAVSSSTDGKKLISIVEEIADNIREVLKHEKGRI